MCKALRIVFVALAAVVLSVAGVSAQTMKYRCIHKVKSKETVFGIARSYGLTLPELINANPEMSAPDYKLMKGDEIVIPYAINDPHAVIDSTASTVSQETAAKTKKRDDMRKRGLRVGVMLPLHNDNGDGKRMIEYYRGVLLACDSLKKDGVSVDIHAWNTAEGSDISKTLADPSAADCDVIIGPLYSKQMAQLSDFVAENDIKLLIPFSINAPQISYNANIFQVYQAPDDYNDAVINAFVERFAGCHAIFIDCNDSTSKKGAFTMTLRKRLENEGRDVSVTSLKTPEESFIKAFRTDQHNVVVLNTGRSPELNVAIAKLKGVMAAAPEIAVTLFGYTEWLMYTKYNLDNFFELDTYIPSNFYYDPVAARTGSIERDYRRSFHEDMMQALPRFAITGFDHAYFFLSGLHKYGRKFCGEEGALNYPAVQTPLRFEQTTGGGYRNTALLFVHYLTDKRTEVILF